MNKAADKVEWLIFILRVGVLDLLGNIIECLLYYINLF